MVKLALITFCVFAFVFVCGAFTVGGRQKRNSLAYDNEGEMVNLEPLDYELAYRLSQKRGIDLGLSRGFSGSQAAKHMLGLAAANMAHGPGKRSAPRYQV